MSPEGAHPYSKRDRSSFDSDRKSCHMSVSHFYSIHRDSRRGSGVLPEMIFNGGNTNLGFTTNMPLLSLPYKNSLSTWTVCSSIFQLACMLIRDSQRLPGILGAPQVLSLLRIGYRCYRCLTSFQGRLLTWRNLLIQDPALHFEFSLRTVLHDCSDFEQGEEGRRGGGFLDTSGGSKSVPEN